jgi:hypothetical protein
VGPIDTKEWRSTDTLRLFAAVAENRVAKIQQVSSSQAVSLSSSRTAPCEPRLTARDSAPSPSRVNKT